MKEKFLSQTKLLEGIPAAELSELLHCLDARQKQFPKDAVICETGTTVKSLGLILSGSVRIENNDIWGNKSILDHIGAGNVFAETYACLPGEPLMVTVVAAEPAEILFLNISRLLLSSSNGDIQYSRLIHNLLMISARKNLTLSRRSFHTSSKSIRGRLLSYLSFQASRMSSCEFTIPFNRQQLADYLNVDRSALSNELSKMQKDGLLEVKKNHFFLYEQARETNG